MTAATEPDSRSSWTDEYLLAHCEGYWVETEAGERVGIVDRVRCAADGIEAQALVVRGLGGGEVVVPVELIAELRPSSERVVVPERVTRTLPDSW